jgi:hypothetical protein
VCCSQCVPFLSSSASQSMSSISRRNTEFDCKRKKNGCENLPRSLSETETASRTSFWKRNVKS